MYGIVSVLGSLLRQLFLPNPFINIFTSQGMAYLFNLIIGGSAIGILAYILTGCIYEKKSAPALGSFLYTISYILITFSFYGVSLLINNIIWATIIYLILYIMLCIALSFFKRETVHF